MARTAAGSGVRHYADTVQLQRSLAWSALAAGLAFLPFTVIMLLLSSSVGALARKVGPRWPMTIGPIVAGVGPAMLVAVVPGACYVTTVLPAVVVFGLGMAVTVAPLTSTVLASVRPNTSALPPGPTTPSPASGRDRRAARAARGEPARARATRSSPPLCPCRS
jgi:MFS family permease